MRRVRLNGRSDREAGFTLVELMIALSVLSTILIMSTLILMQIGSLYSKGVNSAKLQDTNRKVIADVAASLQFGGNPLNPFVKNNAGTIKAYCIDKVRYSYVIDKKLGTDNYTGVYTPHVLWQDTMVNANDPCTPVNIGSDTPVPPSGSPSTGNGREIVPASMRLTKFDISQLGNKVYGLSVWMVYGDDDLRVINPVTGGYACKGGKGTQFCAVSEINTTVAGRL